MQSRIRHLCVYGGLTAVAFWVFWDARIAIPHVMDFQFMAARDLFATDWQYFLNMLSATRTLPLEPRDTYLFRPGSTAVSALIDILFRENRFLLGAFSITLHGLCVYVLFLLLVELVGFRWALLLSSLLIAPYAGMAMVVWRHISPYFCGLILFLLALWVLVRQGDDRRKYRLFAILMFFSSLFHEFVIGVGLLMSLTLVFRRDRRDLLFHVTWPWCVNLVVNLLNFLYYEPTVQEGLGVQKPFAIGVAIVDFFKSWNYLGVYSLFPQLLRFELAEFGGLPLAVHSASSGEGVTGVLLFALVLYFCYRQYRKGVVPLFVCYSMIALVLGHSLGRVSLYHSYRSFSSYYYYFGWLGIIVLLGFFIRWLHETQDFTRRFLLLVLPFIIGLRVANDAYQLRATLYQLYQKDPVSQGTTSMAEGVLRISQSLKKTPEVCYAGWQGREMRDSMPKMLTANLDILLRRQSCHHHPGHPVYLSRHDEKWVWSSRLPYRSKPVELGKQGLSLQHHTGTWLGVRDEPLSYIGNNFLVSPKRYDPLYLEVRVKALDRGGLIFGFRDPQNYMAVQWWKSRWRILCIEKGKDRILKNRPLIRTYAKLRVPLKVEMKVSLERTATGFIVFANDQVVDEVWDKVDLAGRVGIVHFESDTVPQEFTALNVSEAREQSRVL